MTSADLVLHRREKRTEKRHMRFANFQSAAAARDSLFGASAGANLMRSTESAADEVDEEQEPETLQPPAKRQ